MGSDVTELAGPKGRHDQARTAVRHGRERGSVTLGGRRVPVTRPRVRAADGAGELPIPSYQLFGSTEILGRMVMEQLWRRDSHYHHRYRQRSAETPRAQDPESKLHPRHWQRTPPATLG